MTAVKQLTVGSKVLVIGHEDDGERTVVEVYDQQRYPGGVRLNRAVGPDKAYGLFVSWNEDELQVVT